MMKAKFKSGAIAFACAMAFSPLASASFLDSLFVSGVDNTFNDNSREAAIDRSAAGAPDGVFGVGDVLVGFVRLEQADPKSVDITNRLYAIFTQQVSSIFAPGTPSERIIFEATTVGGLTLADLTGIAGLPAGAAIAVYSTPAEPNLITSLPSTGAGSTLADYFADITAGTLEIVAGFGTAADHIISDPNGTAASFTYTDEILLKGIGALPTSVTAASTTGGLSVFAGFGASTSTYAPTVLTINDVTGLPSFHQLVITSGTTRGSVGDANRLNFTDASGFGGGPHAQCTDTTSAGVPVGALGALPCGFSDNADFVVHPLLVPEPGTLAVLGLGLLGMAGLRRRMALR
jgi:hypothetical protein